MRNSFLSKSKIKGNVSIRVFRFEKGEETKQLAILDSLKLSKNKKALYEFYDKYLVKKIKKNIKNMLYTLDGFNAFNYQLAHNHNIVTDEGDALIADLLSSVPSRVKVDGTNGYIAVGSGWTGVTPKQNTTLNTPVGNPKLLENTYPKVKGSFGSDNDNVVQYRAIFLPGELVGTGIDECIIYNNSVPASADCLAYAQITPEVTVTAADTLQVDWELTLLGI